MITSELEERLANLEAEVAQLKTMVASEAKSAVPWWEQISGVFKDSPAFEEAMRLGREWREAQQMEHETDIKHDPPVDMAVPLQYNGDDKEPQGKRWEEQT